MRQTVDLPFDRCEFVYVVEKSRGLNQAAIERPSSRDRPQRQPGRRLGNCPGVAEVPGRGL